MAENKASVIPNERLKQLMADLDALKVKANKAIADGKLEELYAIESEMNKIEKEYKTVAALAVYDELIKEEKPYEAAIIRYGYTTIKHKVNLDDNGQPANVEITQKERQIDLLDFGKKKGLEVDWQYTVSKFNLLLLCRMAQELGKTPAEIKQIDAGYAINDIARQIDMGKTPTSNTQLCKCLQQAINGIIFNDDGKGENTYKCNNHDVGYMLEVYAKKGKGRLSVAAAKDGFMRGIIMTVCYRILTDGRYETEFKQKKASN